MQRLLHSSKFWVAILTLASNVLFYFLPNFPRDIWVSMDIVFGVVIAAYCAEDVAAKAAGYAAKPQDRGNDGS